MKDVREKVIALAAGRAGVENLDPSASLESLGLDSSDAVILAMEVEELIDKEIEVAIFLRFETLAEAAEEIERLALGVGT